MASLAASVSALNADTRLELHQTRLTAVNAAELVGAYDLVCDGSDNFPTRFLLNDACVLAGKTLISAAVLRASHGQISTFKPGGPCYRCLYPEAPPPGTVPSCSEAGVLGAVTGVMGTLHAAGHRSAEGDHGRGRRPVAAGCWYGTRWVHASTPSRVPSDPACPNHAIHG